MSGVPPRRSGGRPTAQAAAQLEPHILDAATAAFLADGYAATSIETIAKASGTAKRTIYARWNGKPALFKAVLERLMARWLSVAGEWTKGATLEAGLAEAADRMLEIALTPEAVALHRLLIAESARFPELPAMMREAGTTQGIAGIAALLNQAIQRGEVPPHDTIFAAEQFMHLILDGPLRRALGLGPKLTVEQTLAWRQAALVLFMSGVRGQGLPE